MSTLPWHVLLRYTAAVGSALGVQSAAPRLNSLLYIRMFHALRGGKRVAVCK